MALPAAGAIVRASDWSTVFPIGVDAWTAYTPTWVQGATISKTVTSAQYIRIGRWVYVMVHMVATSAGTAATQMTVSLPVNAAVSSIPGGSFFFLDASASTFYSGTALVYQTTGVNFTNGGAATNTLGATGGGFTAAIASGDDIRFCIGYQAAS